MQTGGRVEVIQGYDRLAEFVVPVDEGGHYSPFVKEVRVRADHPWLRDIIWADTPGINDPNRLREETTRRWIHQANAVVFVSYAGRALDAADVAFIDANLLGVPARHRLVAINKIDCVEQLDEVRRWIDSLGSSSAIRDRVIFGDKESTVWVCAAGALLGEILRAGLQADDDLAWMRPKLAGLGYLDAEGSGLAALRQLIETRLLRNKGDALIAAHQRFQRSLFEGKLRSSDVELVEAEAQMALCSESEQQLRQRSESLGRRLDDLDGRFRQLIQVTNRRKDRVVAELKVKLATIRGEVEQEVHSAIKPLTDVSHFAHQVCWIVRTRLEARQKELYQALDKVREAVEEILERAVQELREVAGRDGAVSVGVLDVLIDVSLSLILRDMKDLVEQPLGRDRISTIVGESTSFLQRWFDTQAGLNNIRSSLRDPINKALEGSLDGLVQERLGNPLDQKVKEVLGRIEHDWQRSIERQQSAIDAILCQLRSTDEALRDAETRRDRARVARTLIEAQRVEILGAGA